MAIRFQLSLFSVAVALVVIQQLVPGSALHLQSRQQQPGTEVEVEVEQKGDKVTVEVSKKPEVTADTKEVFVISREDDDGEVEASSTVEPEVNARQSVEATTEQPQDDDAEEVSEEEVSAEEDKEAESDKEVAVKEVVEVVEAAKQESQTVEVLLATVVVTQTATVTASAETKECTCYKVDDKLPECSSEKAAEDRTVIDAQPSLRKKPVVYLKKAGEEEEVQVAWEDIITPTRTSRQVNMPEGKEDVTTAAPEEEVQKAVRENAPTTAAPSIREADDNNEVETKENDEVEAQTSSANLVKSASDEEETSNDDAPKTTEQPQEEASAGAEATSYTAELVQDSFASPDLTKAHVRLSPEDIKEGCASSLGLAGKILTLMVTDTVTETVTAEAAHVTNTVYFKAGADGNGCLPTNIPEALATATCT